MADILGLYYKTGGIESGGTNALTGLVAGGTLISRDDAESAPAVLAEQGVVYTLYYRAIDDSTLDDAGKDTAEAVTISAPYDCRVCNVYNGYFGNSVDLPSATGSYQPVYIKRTGVSAATPNLEVGSGGVTFEAGTRLSAPSGLAITLSASGAALDWSDLASADYYEVQRATDSGFTTGVSIVASGLAASEYTDSSLGDYYYRVRGVDERGVGAWCAGVRASVYWSDDFGDASIDSALWATGSDTAGTIFESGGYLTYYSATTTEKGIIVGKKPIWRTASGVVTADMVQGATGTSPLLLRLFDADYSEDRAHTNLAADHALIQFTINAPGVTDEKKVRIRYYNTSNVATYWDPVGNQWTTTSTYLPSSSGQHIYSEGDVGRCTITIDPNGGSPRFKMKMRHVGNAYETESGWADFSNLRGSGGMYVTAEDVLTFKIWSKFDSVVYSAT